MESWTRLNVFMESMQPDGSGNGFHPKCCVALTLAKAQIAGDVQIQGIYFAEQQLL